jgi:acyl-CoA synthetase (AMP-forming)/AMP-acid ligase II/thioesterase domain-containing protein/acyl carrier protein
LKSQVQKLFHLNRILSFTSSHTLVRYLSIYHLLKAQAELRPEAIAIAAPGRKPLSYSRLLQQVDVVVQTLNGLGVGRNDRVALVLPNGPEMAVSFLGVTAGATCAPLNPTYQANEFDFYLSDLKADALIVQSGADSPAIAVAQKSSVPIIELTPNSQDDAGLFALRTEQTVTSDRAGFAEAGDVAVMLHTSGTTSRPKLVALTHTNLLTSADNVAAALLLTERDCCFNMMPLFHIHGLVGALLSSLIARASVVCTPGFDAEQFSSWWEECRPTWYTAVPPLHQAVLSCMESRSPNFRTSSLRLIRSCSAPLPPRLTRDLEEVFQVPVIEAYGMSEAAHQITSNPLPPRERKVGSVGLPVGTEVRVVDQQGNSVPVGECGEIVVRGPNVIRGYANNPAANATSFSSGWLKTGDLGQLDQDGYLFITGRLKEIINRGGAKISPYEVEAVLMDHPAIAESVVFPLPHPMLGEEVAAAIVPAENASLAESEIQRFAAVKLADFKVPSRIAIVNKIPRGPTGKVQRLALAEQLGLTGSDRSAFGEAKRITLPRDKLELRLSTIWREVLGLTAVGIQDDFFALGGYSLLAMSLIARVEKEFHCSLPLRTLYEFPTIERLAGYLRLGKQTGTWSRLIPLNTGGSKPPFFLLHGAERLGRRIGVDRPVYALRPHGFDGQRAPSTVEEMAADYLREIRTVQSAGPYYLGGYSFGGLVALELAQQLTAQSQEVKLLILLDPTTPTNCRTEPAAGGREKIASVSKGISWRLHLIKSAAKMMACQAFLVRGRRVPERFRIFYFLELSRRATQNYVAKVYTLPVALFRTQERKSLNACWSRLLVGQTETYDMPGGHLDVIRGTHVKAWAERISACLRKPKEN